MHEHPATGPWRRYKRQVCAGILLVNVMLLGAVGTPNHVLARTGGVVADRPSLPTQHVQQGGGIVESIFNYIINATVYFPARTFQEAFEKASTNILTGQLDRIRGPMQEVVHIYAFTNAAVFGSAPIPAEVKQIGQRLTEAAVPIWVLSLVLVALSALTRSASGQPVGLTELAEEGTRWLFIAIASGNGASIVSWAHTGFGALAYTIASSGGVVSAGEFVGAFFPHVALAKTWPLLLLVFATILGFIVIVVLAITYIARYALLFAITGLAPICIALGGISFTRFAFREWLSTFMQLEFLQLLNVTVLVIFKALGFLAAANAGSVTQAVLLITVMLGLSSVLIGINVAAFKQVFGTALDVAAQMRSAASSIVSGLVQMGGVVAGAALGGGVGAMPAALSTAAAGTGASSSGEAAQGESSGKENSQAHGDEGLGFSSTMARAWANATGSSFARGLADGSAARQDQQRQRNLSARVEEQQHAAEQRRAESLARETGASSSDDIESIASNITSPPAGHNREQMIRAYRDSAGLLREMSQTYGGPARAAAVAGYRNFAELAKALVDERLQQGQPAERSSQESTAPTDSNVNSEQSDEASAPTTSQTDEGLNVRSDQTAAAAQAENAISVSAKSGETLASSLTALPSPGAVTQPPSELGAAASQPLASPMQVEGASALATLSPANHSESVSPPSFAATPTTTQFSPDLATQMASDLGATSSQSSESPMQAEVISTLATPSNADPSPSTALPAPAAITQSTSDFGAASAQSFESPMPSGAASTLTMSGTVSQGVASNQSVDSSIQAEATAASATPSNTVQSGAMSPALSDRSPTTTLRGPDSITQAAGELGAASSQSNPQPGVESSAPGSLSGLAGQLPKMPMQDWINSPPQLTDPGNQSMLPFDFGAGGLLTNATHSDPTHAPLWAKTAYSLRMAYGEEYVQSLFSQVQQEGMDESQLMEHIDQEVSDHPSTRPVARFWRPDGGFPNTLNKAQHD